MRYKGIPIDEISLFSTPKIYSELLLKLSKDWLFSLFQLAIKRAPLIASIVALWLGLLYIPFLHTPYRIIIFALYWIALGVASSIGLGTGLHTFILYLGPHIAKLALTATICGKVPEMLPSRWDFDHFAQCKNPEQQKIGFFGILLAVQLESFLWGLGTAIGELPPYFVAKKAAETRAQLRKMKFEAEKTLPIEERQSLEKDQSDILIEKPENIPEDLRNEHKDMPIDELMEIQELKKKSDLNFVEKVKLFIFNHMEKYGFWAILACASIPNPLFDLAGITSGHFRIPFKTFFTATFIGKAIIKVHIQMLFIIAIFRKETLDLLGKMISSISASLADSFSRTLETKKKQLNQPYSIRESKSFLTALWDLFITAMVLYFLKSIIDAYVKQKAIALRDS